MDIIHLKYNEITNYENLCCCIGYFDGLHLGHRQLLEKTLNIGQQEKLKTGLITFSCDPNQLIFPHKSFNYLLNEEDRNKILIDYGFDYLFIIDFDNEILNLDSDKFVLEYIIKLGIKYLICGFDFSYGYKGLGKANDLLKYPDFQTIIIDSYNYEQTKVSSTYIKQLLKSGDIKLANYLLSTNYQLKGVVTNGKKIGRLINYPTANLDLSFDYQLPANGVYVTICY
ncbi:MAG: riboflavin kinase, partial [Erysipelotrichaceae bacterium]